MNSKDLIGKIAEGSYDEALATMYGREALTAQRERYSRALERFEELYPGSEEVRIFSAPRYAATTLTISGDACWLRLSIWMLLP